MVREPNPLLSTLCWTIVVLFSIVLLYWVLAAHREPPPARPAVGPDSYSYEFTPAW